MRNARAGAQRRRGPAVWPPAESGGHTHSASALETVEAVNRISRRLVRAVPPSDGVDLPLDRVNKVVAVVPVQDVAAAVARQPVVSAAALHVIVADAAEQ